MTGEKRILLAEDESITRVGLQTILRDLGYEVAGAARDGVEALEMARALRPDLAILDIKMPGMDGLAVAEIISREQPMPIVILTAFSDREYVERAKSTAVHAYLVKPIKEETLQPTIEVAQARFREMQALGTEAQTLEEALETRDLLAQAKGVLMDMLGIGETEAFRRIHRQARDSRRSMRSVAQEIIDEAREDRK